MFQGKSRAFKKKEENGTSVLRCRYVVSVFSGFLCSTNAGENFTTHVHVSLCMPVSVSVSVCVCVCVYVYVHVCQCECV